ncbi:MAG: cytidylate kinase [Alphaproteobacteria bacterium]|nr:MAG: cytidylate kinase [Alphaproteobacteria bacterium]
MKPNDFLEQFYTKRQSIIKRLLIIVIVILLVFTASLQFQQKENFIAKITVEGIIKDRNDILEQLKDLDNDQNVKGLITIINSPGGTYVGSKEIHESIKKLSRKIPTVAYMREIATSGGYLVSLSSDRIFGNEGTITGSIGVILQTADISQLLGKLGINPVIIKSGDLKAVPNPAEEIDEKKLNYLKDVIKKMQTEFLNLVKKSRDISSSTLDLVSDGRIVTGKQAKDLKLIDAVGTENDALSWLKKEAGLDDDVRVKDLSIQSDITKLLNFSFLKKKINYLNQNFYNGFIAIWTPGI